MLNAIYASKLYRSSPRKDKIEAAFDNPINSELVGQLATALDEQYQTPDYLVKEKEPKVEEEPKGTAAPAAEDTSDTSAPPLGSGGHGGPPPSPDTDISESEDETDSDSEGEPTAEDTSSGDLPPAPDFSNIEESTLTNKAPIKGSLMRDPFKNMRQVADQIKGMLNFKDSTHGVNRILCKENELWIYYNDDVNLNNVMADVIEILNAASYSYLEFNRLARSDNAIVFLIDFSDSNNMVQADPVGTKK